MIVRLEPIMAIIVAVLGVEYRDGPGTCLSGAGTVPWLSFFALPRLAGGVKINLYVYTGTAGRVVGG